MKCKQCDEPRHRFGKQPPCTCEKTTCWVCGEQVLLRMTSFVVCTKHRVCWLCDELTKRNPPRYVGKAIADPEYAVKLLDRRLAELRGNGCRRERKG